jgi:integrase
VFEAEKCTTSARMVPETRWESYRIVVHRVTRRIGNVKLQALTPLELERFYRELVESGGSRGGPLSSKTVRTTHTVVRKALDDAERLGPIIRNPTATARPSTAQPKKQRTWTSDQLRHFLDSIEDDRLFALYVFLATTGMRRGEVIGVRWTDLDLDAGEVRIVQTPASVRQKLVFTTSPLGQLGMENTTRCSPTRLVSPSIRSGGVGTFGGRCGPPRSTTSGSMTFGILMQRSRQRAELHRRGNDPMLLA